MAGVKHFGTVVASAIMVTLASILMGALSDRTRAR